MSKLQFGIFTENHAQNQSQSISFLGGMPPDPLGLGMLKHAWLYFVQLQVPYHYQRASAAPVHCSPSGIVCT